MVWRVDVSAYAAEGAPNAAGGLWKVQVSVRPRGAARDMVQLKSLRLGGEG
jgi:hypothetical protein